VVLGGQDLTVKTDNRHPDCQPFKSSHFEVMWSDTVLPGDAVWPPGVSRGQLEAAVAKIEAGFPAHNPDCAPPPADREIRALTAALCASSPEDRVPSRGPEPPSPGGPGGVHREGPGDGDGKASAAVAQAQAAQRLLLKISGDPALGGLARAADILATSLGAGWLLGWLLAAGQVTRLGEPARTAATATARAYEIATATALVALDLEINTAEGACATWQARGALENYSAACVISAGTAADDATVAALGRALRGDCRPWTPEEMTTATVPGLLAAARALVRGGHAARARAVFFVLAPTPPHAVLFEDAHIWGARQGSASP
jgi:hypothetical protein